MSVFCSGDLPQATRAVEFNSLVLKKEGLQYLITNHKKPRGREWVGKPDILTLNVHVGGKELNL